MDAPVTIDMMIDAAPVTVDLPITQDTHADSLNPSTAFGISTTMLVDGGGQASVSLWRVELTSIPTTATVQVAELHITTGGDTGDSSMVFEMLEAWSETSVSFNQRNTGVVWSGVGITSPSRGTTAIGGPVSGTPSSQEQIVAIDRTVVRKWIQNPASNFGAAMVMGTSDGTTYRTREDSNVARQPFLHLTYVP